MQECCAKGFRWEGTPTGSESRICNSDCYISGPSSDRALLLIHDGAGWKSPNARLLADHFAKEVGATVYIPDFFKEDPFPHHLATPGPDGEFDLATFMAQNPDAIRKWGMANAKPRRRDEIFAIARELKSKYTKVGAVGYCWGGWGSFQLGDKNDPIVDAISVAHPSMLTTEEIDAIGVPVQVLVGSKDVVFVEQLREHTLQSLPKSGVAFSYQLFPGQEHGFASRGNPKKPGERKSMARATDATVTWFKSFLAED